MPPRRSPLPLLAVGLALAPLLAACGTSSEDATTTTTEVVAAAGSGFCLGWSRYQESLGDWLVQPPTTLEDAADAAATSVRAAEEARSEAPEELVEPLDQVVATMEAVEGAVADADALPDALDEAAGLFQGDDLARASTAATDWAAASC